MTSFFIVTAVRISDPIWLRGKFSYISKDVNWQKNRVIDTDGQSDTSDGWMVGQTETDTSKQVGW
jgi:hypothetical protein